MKPVTAESPPLRDLRQAARLAAAGDLQGWGDTLAAALYAGWYAGWLDGQGRPLQDPSEPFVAATAGLDLVAGSSRDLTGALRWAHAGSDEFELGWRAERVSSAGRVLASRDGEVRLFDPMDYVALGRLGLPPRVGGDLAAVRRRESLEASPGFWLTAGDAWPSEGNVPALVRIYWNVRGEDAPALVSALTRALLDGPPTWALKLPVDLAQHVRRDAAVVYIPRTDFTAHAGGLAAAAAVMQSRLIPHEPALTLRLAPGVGLAEDPAGNESFGMNRCTLVAEGLASASQHHPEVLLTAVVDRLRAAGIDPERPHLDPGSRHDYRLPATRELPRVKSQTIPSILEPRVSLPVADSQIFLDGARVIASQLVQEALWHQDRCTWIGDAVVADGGRWSVAARTCEGDVYGGTAGIGRFLAQWAVVAGDGAAADAAAGALHHSLRMARRDGLARGGIFLGPIGIAWAALETADLLDDPALRGDARALACDAAAAITATPAGGDDVVGGEAGSIIGLLAVAHRWGDAPSLPAARAAASRLLANARRSGLGWHWPGEPSATGPYGLCGLAHGTSGIALAFLSLYSRAADDGYLEAVRGALAYERRWYRGEAVGWPDLRELTGTDLALNRGLAHPALWCHGAAGAGLVRLVAFAQDHELMHLAEAGAALHASRAQAAQVLRELAEASEEASHAANWSLCHGLMGTAELMLNAATSLSEAAHLQAARRLGERAIADRMARGSWRCGVPYGGETPGLLLGLAGIGTTLLRLHDPSLALSPALPGMIADLAPSSCAPSG